MKRLTFCQVVVVILCEYFCFASSSCSALVPNLILVNFRLIVALLLEFGFFRVLRRGRAVLVLLVVVGSSVSSPETVPDCGFLGTRCRRQFAAVAPPAARSSSS